LAQQGLDLVEESGQKQDQTEKITQSLKDNWETP